MTVVLVRAPAGGLNTESAPEALDSTEAAELQNFLPREGKAVLRGPLRDRSTMPNFDARPITGTMVYNDQAFAATTASTSRVQPSVLYRYNLTTKSWSVETITPASQTTASTYMPTTRSVQQGPEQGASFAWGGGISTDPSSAKRAMISWTGAGISRASSFNTGTNVWTFSAPWARGDHQPDLTSHLDRLWTLAADFDANNQDGYGIRWTDPGGISTAAFADTTHAVWKDDASNLYNVINLPRNGDRPRAFGKAGDQLLIFTADTIWMLSGRTVSSFVLRQVVSSVGCLKAETVVNWNDACYFLSREGYMRFDGSSLVNVSAPVRAELVAALEREGLNDGGTIVTTFTKVGQAAALPGGYIYLTVGSSFAALYDIRRQVWTRFSTAGAGRFAPTETLFSSHTRRTYGLDRVYAYDMTVVGLPEAVAGTIYGADFNAQTGVTGTGIPASWRSRTQRLSSPFQRSTLDRIAIDTAFQGTANAGPTISLVNGRGQEVMPPAPTDLATTEVQRRRYQNDLFAEQEDVAVRVDWSEGATLDRAEVYDAALEFRTASDRTRL